MTRRLLLLLGYLATIIAANWAIARYGIIPVGFGLAAPAGVLFAGAAFTLRDLLQDATSRWFILAAICAGALLSVAVAPPMIAAASGAAFLLSELVDFAVYTPLRRRHRLAAVGLSNTVGAVIDSAVFLWLAFGSLAFLPGQVLGKTYTTLAAVMVLAAWRRGRGDLPDHQVQPDRA